MAVLFLLTAAALSVTGLVTGNRTFIDVSWVLWGLGLVLMLFRRSRRRIASPQDLAVAAASGDMRALRGLAMVAKINKDLDEAERLLRQGVDAGDNESMWEMGRLVEDRDGLAASEQWFRMAAEHGHFVAKRFFRTGSALNPDGSNPL